MPTIIISPNEIELNGVRYLLGGDGQIHPKLTSIFAPKQVIGDYGKDSDPNRSIWSVIDDQSGGIGIEDMDESRHANRSCWSTLNQEYPGHNFLPRLATSSTLPTLPTITNGDVETWGSPTDCTGWVTGGTGTPSFNQGTGANAHGGTYGLGISVTGGAGLTATGSRTLNNWSNNFRNTYVTMTFWAAAGSMPDGGVTVGIYDGVTLTTTAVATDGNWAQYTVSKQLGAAATGIIARATITQGSSGATTFYIDDIVISAIGTLGYDAVDFNGETYFYAGKILYRVSSSDGAIYLVAILPTNISSIISSIGSCLYVGQGTSNYYYMSTTYAFSQTDAPGDKFIQWDNKFFRYVASTGQLSYTAVPNTASPSFTNNGLIDTGSQGTVNKFITYSDAGGTDIIYAGTTKGLLSHDYANALWLNTDLKVPSHVDNGKGLVVQNGNLYYSAGLSVYEYNPANATIRNVGVDIVDGLPDEYMGSITNMFGGYGGEFYACIDASLISSDNFSSIHKYRNGAWSVTWLSGTANLPVYFGILTSTYTYRIWFASGATVYYQGLDRARRNPLKVTTNYGASAIYLSPWFDADWPVGNKLALANRILAKGTTANETVTVKYRINKVNIDLATGWTTLDTLVAADAGVESVVAFGSGSGVLFKTIQYRVEVVTGTSTSTPDIIYMTLEYDRIITPKWGWTFVVDCSQEYNLKSPSQLLDALKTAAETQTLVTFYYKDVAKYVKVSFAEGDLLTGDKALGKYTVTLIEK